MITGFVVHKSDGTSSMSKPTKKGLFFSDVKHDIAHILVNTADSIKDKYTVKGYSGTHKTQSLQDIIGAKDYIRYLENNMLPNCPITKADILRAENILGPNRGSLKVKTTRKTPSRVIVSTCNELPDGILE